MQIIDVIHRVRPAPLQVFLVELFGLNRRREITFHGMRLSVDPSSHLGAHLIGDTYEADMISTLEAYLKPGGVFIDLGANEGLYSVMGARLVGPTGKVLAVEPQSRLVPIIERNLELNGCGNVVLERCLVGQAAGEATLHLAPTTNSGASSTVRPTRYKLSTETVPCWPLEALVDRAGLRTVDLVKIDTEGGEYDILIGAAAFLKTGRLRAIALDYHPSVLAKRGVSMAEIHAVLIESGYRQIERAQENSVYEFVGGADQN